MDGLIVQLLNEKWRTFIKFKYIELSSCSIDHCHQLELISRFFQRMAIFTLYFSICVFALILRGYYRVPSECIIQEVLPGEEHAVKSIIADRAECKCHYTNFLWRKSSMDEENSTIFNRSMETIFGDVVTEEQNDNDESRLIGIVSHFH